MDKTRIVRLRMQRLTEQQRRQWQIDGYLHIEGALNPGQVALMNREMDRNATVSLIWMYF